MTKTPGDLEKLIGYNLKRAWVSVAADFRRTMGADGMSPRVFATLSLAVQNPDITQSEVARRLGIDRSGLVAIVDELERSALVARADIPGDRRLQALVPTPQGQRVYRDCLNRVRAHEERLFSVLSDEEKSVLLRLLGKIRSAQNTP